MSDRIDVKITATDGASRVFGQVSSGADNMGSSLGRATTASQRFSAAGAAIGASLGIAVVAFGQFGRAAAEAEAAQAQIQAAVEATGATFEEYRAQIEAASNQALTLSFDDEDALAAMAAITTATGDTAEAIDQLGLVMDIARGRNIDLAAASKIVIAAEQGRYGSLARLGIQLDANASKEDALAALQTKYAGQAEAYASTSAGAFDHFKNSLENVEEAIGAHSEAATSLALVAQTIGPAFTVASTAVGAFGKAVVSAVSSAAQLSTVGLKASAGISGLTTLLSGPVGIVGAAGLAAVGIGLLADYLSTEYVDATDLADQATSDFTQSLIQLGQQGTLSMLNQQIAQQGLIISQYAEDQAKAADETQSFIEKMTELQTFLGGPGGVVNAHTEEVTKSFTDAQIALIDGIQQVNGEIVQGTEDGVLSFEELQLAIDNTNVSLTNTGETAQEYAQSWSAAQEDVIAIMSATGPAAVEAQKELLAYLQGVKNGNQQMSGFADSAGRIRDEMDAANAAMIAGGEATDEATAANERYVSSLEARTENASRVTDAMAQDAQHMGDAVEGNTQATQAYVSALEFLMKIEAQAEQMTRGRNQTTMMFGLSLKDATSSVTQLNTALAQQEAYLNTIADVGDRYAGRVAAAAKADAADIEAVTGKWRERAEAVKQAEDAQRAADYAASRTKFEAGSLQRFAEAADAAAAAAATEELARSYDVLKQSFTGASDALESGFRTVVGNTNAMAQQSQAVADWAEELIKAEGVYSKLDDLVNAGRITGESGVFTGNSEYAQAQQAYNSILEDNAAIQDHVLTIQAKQAPMLAEMESNLESYLGTLAEATPEQQAFALAMMDSSTSAQAFDLATGLLENRDVFGPMAESIANLNPYIGEALVQMGLMTKTLDESTGTYVYTLVAETGDSQSEIKTLTASIEALNKTFTIAFGIEVDTSPLDDLRGKLNPFGGGSDTGTSGIEVAITADSSAAMQTIGEVTGTTIPDKTAVVLGDNSGAMTAIADVGSSTIDGKTLTIGGDNVAALSAIQAVNDTAVYDKTMTINVVTAYSTIGTPSIGLGLGGVARYATGGVVASMAEWGPELLHFPNGGTALARTPGLYNVPSGTYVDTAPVTAGKLGGLGGPTINISINAPVFGVDDLEVKIAESISRAWTRGMRQHELSVGAY